LVIEEWLGLEELFVVRQRAMVKPGKVKSRVNKKRAAEA
jgi:hypothetical protein